MHEDIVTMKCSDDNPKKYRITMDGGSTGPYIVECCVACKNKDDFRFMIKEEVLSQK